MKASGSSSGEISRGAWVSRALGLAFSGVVAVAQVNKLARVQDTVDTTPVAHTLA